MATFFFEKVKEYEKLAYQLGIKPDEFWDMIPSEFVDFYISRVDFIQKEHRRMDWRFGMLASVIVNTTPRKNKKTFKPEDFMPKEKKQQTTDEMLATVKMLQKMYGGSFK